VARDAAGDDERSGSTVSRTARQLVRGGCALVAAVVIVVVVTDRGELPRSETGSAPTSTLPTSTPASRDRTPALVADEWDQIVGTWVIEGSRARLESSETDSESNNLLIVDTGTTDYTIRAALDIASTSSGLIFRYQDPRNYWALEAIRYYGLWRVYRIVDGVRTDLATFEEPICCREGVLLSASTTNSGDVVLGIDSAVLWRTTDPLLADSTAAGLFSRGDDATDAHFSSVEVLEAVPDA